MNKTKLLKHLFLLFAMIVGSSSAWGDTTVSYGWETGDDATKWTISEAIVQTSGQGNTGTYAGKINTNHTYVQFNEKVYVKSFSFAFKRTSNNNNYNVYIETSTDGETWTAVETYAMSSFNNGSYLTKSHTFDGTKEYYVRFHCYNTTATRYVDDVTITYSNGAANPSCAAPTFQPAAGLYSSSQNVTISSETQGATIYYTMGDNPADPTTSSTQYTGAINVSSTTTIKAIAVANGLENSAVVEAKYVILAHAGTVNDPYTVSDARAAIDAGTGTGVNEVYATGIVSEIVTAYDSGYKNITFNFVDETGDETFLQAYRCAGNEAANVAVGDVVVVSGNLIKYGTTYEFGQGCQLVSLTHPTTTTPVINADDVEIEYNATAGEIEYTIINSVEGGSLTAATTDNWISNIAVSNDKVTFTTTANEGDADRTATVTLSYPGAADKVVTVTQKHYVIDYVELPFEFDNGKAEVESTTGLTHNGLGSDYGSSPKLKFDGTGDWLLLHFNERPGTLTFDIKGNSFSEGSFKVQTSTDGVTFTDLETYDDLGNIQAEEFNNLSENVRYIKWIYTEKVNGNVALGNIKLTKYVDPSTISQIEADDVEIAYSATSGEIPFTIVNPVENASFGAGTFDTPWITQVNAVKIDATHYKVTFNTEANTGDERSATITINYNGVNKDVTVTQTAAPVVSGSEINAVDEITLEAEATSGEIAYTITNPVAGTALTATVGDSFDWISNIQVTADKVTFTVTPNQNGDHRLNVMYLHYGSVQKNVTIIQKAYIPQGEDVTSLPFTFDYGVNAVAPCDGLSQEGLGKDYSSSPYLKFDSTGDWLLLHFNETPGTLSYLIKGNEFSGGTFTVQTSVDGTTFTDLKAYTELGAVQNEVFDNLDEDVRYIKWIYTNKSNGNVALGNISLGQYDPTPSITVTPEEVNVSAAETDGTLTVTYKNVEVSAGVEVQFCNANGGDAYYDWIDAEINDENNVDYIVFENTGKARTAYLKVYGVDAESNDVYSNIVTITQAASVAERSRYEKVTSTADITDGQYLIVYEDANIAFNGDLDALDAEGNTIEVEITDDMIVASTTTRAAEFTIVKEADADTYTIKSASGFYIGQSSDSNGMKVSETTSYSHSISFSGTNNDADLVSSGAHLRFNSAINQNRFRYYKSSSYSSQQAIQLYKYIPVTVPVTVTEYKWATLSSEYAMDFSTMTDLKAYIVTGDNGSTILTEEVSGKVKAGTGLLVYSETAGNYDIPIAAETGSDYSDSNKLIAVTKKMTVNKADEGTTNYVLTVKNDKAVFAYIDNTPAVLRKGQAYLNLDGAPSAPYLGFEGEGTTGIMGLTPALSQGEGACYDLSGCRVENPSKGVYIINGRKVVIK